MGSEFSLELLIGGPGRTPKRFKDARKGLQFFSQSIGIAFTDLNPTARRVLDETLRIIVKAMQQRHSQPWNPAAAPLPRGERGGRLAKRSGDLINSIERTVKVVAPNRLEIRGEIGVAFPGAVHERGAVITPRRAKFLAIPLPAALDSRGLPIRPRPRDWPNTFVQTSRKGNLLIFQRRGSKIVPLYVLKKRVRIPPRLGLEVTIEESKSFFVDRLFDRLFKEVRSKIGGRGL